MKSAFIITLTFLLMIDHAIASGNERSQTGQSPSVTYLPYEKSEKSLQSYIYDIKRKNVSIHSISLNENTFQIKGKFSNKADFDMFVEQLKGNGEVNREIEVAKKRDSYQGSTSYDFEIKGLNIWK